MTVSYRTPRLGAAHPNHSAPSLGSCFGLMTPFVRLSPNYFIVGFRRHTLLPLDDCLYALQPTIPHLTRSSLHRCLQRHGIGRLAQIESDKPAKKKFKSYPIGFFHIDIAEVQTAEGKLYLFVTIDRTSKFAFVQLAEKANRVTASAFLVALVKAEPSRTRDPHS